MTLTDLVKWESRGKGGKELKRRTERGKWRKIGKEGEGKTLCCLCMWSDVDVGRTEASPATYL